MFSLRVCREQSHSSVERAGLIGAVRMRKLETDEKGSLRGPTLQAAILEDKAKGLLPFFVSVADVFLAQAC